MSGKIKWWAGALFFAWLTYKFATQGATYMGAENNKAIWFTGALAVICVREAVNKSSA